MPHYELFELWRRICAKCGQQKRIYARKYRYSSGTHGCKVSLAYYCEECFEALDENQEEKEARLERIP